MRTFWKVSPMKVAAAMLALGVTATLPACAQTYGDHYYGNDSASGYPLGAYGADGYYSGGAGYYGDNAFGYCDIYGCPDDYWNLPLYYGSVYYDGAWLGGPLYYRDWGGSRQYWIHGGWHHDGWRGVRPNQYSMGYTGPALGLNWYRSHRVFRRGFNGGAGHGYSNHSFSGGNAYDQRRYYGYGGQGNNGRYGYGGHTANSTENSYRNSFTGQANRGEFRGLSQGGGHNAGTMTPGQGSQMGRSGGAGGHFGGGDHGGGQFGGQFGGGHR